MAIGRNETQDGQGNVIAFEEFEIAPPPKKILTHLQFIELSQSAGGMTDAMLVEVEANPLFKAFWIKFNMAGDINPAHALTTQALTALHAGGYLPNGVQAVFDAWPTI